MKKYLKEAELILKDWSYPLFAKTSLAWWEDCVMPKIEKLSNTNEAEGAFDELDFGTLLRLIDKSWYELQSANSLLYEERILLKRLLKVNNNWAFMLKTIPGKDIILEDLQVVFDYFKHFAPLSNYLEDIQAYIDMVKLSSYEFEESTFNDIVTQKNEIKRVEIEEKSMIYLISNPEEKGIVMSVSSIGNMKKYNVFLNGKMQTFYDGQIALINQDETYDWIDKETLHSYLTAYQINNPSNNNLYSLNSARIDFVPYQFRPALKMIHADEPRILVADSVGVGKTIEAGLIIKELQARNELDNIMIICPKPLVTERKWELEMKRFDEDFVALQGADLRQIISDIDRDGEWPTKYSKVIVPYSILDSRVYGNRTSIEGSTGLLGLDPAPYFDLVIIDEAHHIRNGSVEKDKAYAYKCVKYFCEHAKAVVMLTATPLQTSDRDLFTLLHLLRPDVVINEETFKVMSRPNAFISNCVKILRGAGENWQKNALDELKRVHETQWGENVVSKNPVYLDAVQQLGKEHLMRDERVQLISNVESLHSFHTMLNRTRRKDIQDFCVRRSHTIEVPFTETQNILYNELLYFESQALLQLHDNESLLPFMMSTIKRQAASCIFGLAPYIETIIQKRLLQVSHNETVLELSETHASVLNRLAKNLLQLCKNLPEDDPKFDRVYEIIAEKNKLENNKIIIFSTFKHTLRYLEEKIAAKGLRVAHIDGDVKDEQRLQLRMCFELPKEDVAAIDILLFTEVGSEGLDYQFCDMMINYDLPWNPMRIEQRIGRIDRRGQKSEVVNIYNVLTSDTVDADIYHRCLMRIGIFEQSIGECEVILGEIAKNIDEIAMDASLNEEERRRKIEQMADNEVRKVQELNRLEEEEKELFGFDLTEFMTAQEIQRAENPWLSAEHLQILIEKYLEDRLGPGKYILGTGTVKQIRLSFSGREVIREDLKNLSGSKGMAKKQWERYLKGKDPLHQITFDANAAEQNRDAFFLTSTHPLVRQAALHFSKNDIVYIALEYTSDVIPSGEYYFAVYAWKYVGNNPHTQLQVICSNDEIENNLLEIITEAQCSQNHIAIDSAAWDVLEEKHIQYWMDAKTRHWNTAQTAFQFRSESVTNNFINQRRDLEQKMQTQIHENMQRMYMREIENATEAYEKKIEELKQMIQKNDIHATMIVKGVLEVR